MARLAPRRVWQMSSRLSRDQVEHYRREGYLIYEEPVFAAEKFGALKAEFEKKLIRWTEVSDLTPEHMDVPHFTDPGLFQWLFADELLDLIEPLIGRDIALWASNFLCKPPRVGKRVPWHEDSAYFGAIFQPMEMVTLWLAIDPSLPKNGGMRVVPRTHHDGFSEYETVEDHDGNTFSYEMRAGQITESQAVDLTLRPNQCSLHHVKLVHGSNPNEGTMRRCGFVLRYIPTTTQFLEDARHAGWGLYLARGTDHAGNFYDDPSKINHRWLEANPLEMAQYEQMKG